MIEPPKPPDGDGLRGPRPLEATLRQLARAASNPGEAGAQAGTPLRSLDEERQRAAIDDQRADTTLKVLYAKRFIWILVGQLALLNAVFIGVGLGCLHFSEPMHLNLFMGGTLAEVFGAVFVITKYLFHKRSG